MTHRHWNRTASGAFTIEYRDGHGHLDRWGAPARITDDPNAYTRTQEWFRHGQLDNSRGPAILKGVDGADLADEVYFYRRNQQHRDGGPAATWRDLFSGLPKREEWLRDGVLDRKDGPAVIASEPGDPQRISYEWWRNGERVQPTAHEQLAWAQVVQRNGGPFFPEEPFHFARETAKPAPTRHRPRGYEAAF
jgi:hypothetical protein